jgi:predicted acyl esterase
MSTRLDPSVTTPTQPGDTKPGLNKIVIKTMHYGLQGMIMEREVPVKMRDGVKLYVNVFRPDKTGKFPVVMSADIYGKDELPGKTYDRIPNTGVIGASVFAPFESPDPGFWVPNDYALVKAALRGSSNSEGGLFPQSSREAQDYYELIEWAAAQEWSTGAVGTNGVSYLATTQWFVASLNPPHLKAMIPWEGQNDLYRDKAFHGGIPETEFYRGWFKRLLSRWPGREIEDLGRAQREHPLFDEYWKDKQAKLSQIKVPMYVGSSWSTQGLHNRGTQEGFKQSSSKHKWLEVHGRKEWEYYYTRETLERQKRFFDYFLKGIENDWLETPKVRLEVRERFFDGTFRFEEEWPLARTNYTKLYLDNASIALGHSLPAGEAKVSYSTEPSKGDSHSLVFKICFDQDTELTGYMKLKLWVSAEGSDDMDLFVGIKKFDKRGQEVYLADYNHIENGEVAAGWLRVSHRELELQKSTPYQPWLKHERLLKLKEGKVVPVEIEIWPSSTLFRASESLGLVIQGSDIITEGYRGYHRETVNKGKHVIHSGGQYDSHLLVPVIPSRC